MTTMLESALAFIVGKPKPRRPVYDDMLKTVTITAAELKAQVDEFTRCDCVAKLRRVVKGKK